MSTPNIVATLDKDAQTALLEAPFLKTAFLMGNFHLAPGLMGRRGGVGSSFFCAEKCVEMMISLAIRKGMR